MVSTAAHARPTDQPRPAGSAGKSRFSTITSWFDRKATDEDRLPWGASLQVDPGWEWSLEDALNRALEVNPDVLAARAAVERQEGVYMQVRARLLPNLGVVASAEQKEPTLIDRDRRFATPPLSNYADRSYDARVELRQNLFDGFGTWNQSRRQAFLKKQTVHQAREVSLRVASLVRQGFDAVLLRQNVVEVRMASVASLTKMADFTERRWRAGQVAEYQSLRAHAALKSAEADLAQAQSDLQRSREFFRRLLQLPFEGDHLRLRGHLVQERFSLSFEEALWRAKTNRPDLHALAAQMSAAEHGVKAANAGMLPQLDIYGSYGMRSSYFDESVRMTGWTVGVVGRWNIFDGLETTGRVKMQQAEKRSAEIRLAEMDYMIGSQIKELYATMEQSRSIIDAQQAAVELGRRGLDEAERLYQIGEAALDETLNAQVALSQARIGYQLAIFNYNAAVYQIEYATGGDFEPYGDGN